MKTNKYMISLLSTVLISISFTACGSSDKKSNTVEVEEFNEDLFEKINISKTCTSPDTIDEYITLKRGDKIVKDEDGTKISILHDENSVKKVCINTGIAHISRAKLE